MFWDHWICSSCSSKTTQDFKKLHREPTANLKSREVALPPEVDDSGDEVAAGPPLPPDILCDDERPSTACHCKSQCVVVFRDDPALSQHVQEIVDRLSRMTLDEGNFALFSMLRDLYDAATQRFTWSLAGVQAHYLETSDSESHAASELYQTCSGILQLPVCQTLRVL